MTGNREAKDESGWLPELDGLRCLAALSVAVVHFTPVTAPANSLPMVLRNYGQQFSIANLSVAFFYGLSAFLLTYIELKRRQAGRSMNVRRFYLRRTLRIWPLYFFIIAIGFLITAPGVFQTYAREDITAGRQWGLEHLWMYLTFTSNWSLAWNGMGGYTDHAISSLQVLWSIAVEEQFYLFFPAFLLLCFRKPKIWVKLIVSAVALGLASRIALISAGESFSNKAGGYIYYATSSYLEVFAAGALAAAIVTEPGRLAVVRRIFCRRFLGISLTAILLALGWLWSSHLFPPYSGATLFLSRITDYAITVTIYPLVGVLIAAILIWVNVNTHSIMARFLRTRFMRALGTLSFGIYVWHPLIQPVIQTMDSRYVATMPPALRLAGVNLLFVLYLSLCIGCAGLSYFFIEAPVLRWKERLAGHAGNLDGKTPQDNDRSPTYIFPGAVAIAMCSAILVSAQLLHPADSPKALQPLAAATVVPQPAKAPPSLHKPPAGLTVSRQARNSLILKWKPLKDVERYELEIVEQHPDGALLSRVAEAPGTNDSYGLRNLSRDWAYSFRIRSCSASDCSDWSAPPISITGRQPRGH